MAAEIPLGAIATFLGLTKAVDGLKDAFAESLKVGDDSQKASLALGQTYKDTTSQLGSTMQGLRGDLQTRISSSMAGMAEGLQGNTAGLAKLINQQKLTGTQHAKSAKVQAQLEATLGLSRESADGLSESFISTGSKYQISTDKLVDAVGALQGTMASQRISGMGDKLVGAVASLQGELGPALTAPLNSVMQNILDTSLEGYARLTRLGIGDVRERISAAKNSAEAQSILKSAIITASKNFTSITGGAEDAFFKIGVASEVFGQQSIDFTTVAANFGKRIKQEEIESKKYAETLATLRSEILVPLHNLYVNSLFPNLVKFALLIRQGSLVVFDGFRLLLNKITVPFDNLMFTVKQFVDVFKNNSDLISAAVHFGLILPFESAKIGFNIFMNGLDGVYSTVLLFGKSLLFVLDNLPFLGDFSKEIKVINNQMLESLDRIVARNESMGDSFTKIIANPVGSGDALRKAFSESRDDPTLLGNRLLGDMLDTLEESKMVQEKTEEHVARIPEVRTTPEFLDQTANILGRSIEGILGIGRDTTAEEMLEELRTANEQRALQAATGGSSSNNSTAVRSR